VNINPRLPYLPQGKDSDPITLGYMRPFMERLYEAWRELIVSRRDVQDRLPWTPVIAGSTTAGTQTYTSQLGYYIVDRGVCEVWGNIGLSAKDAATAGNLSIQGLPVPAANLLTIPVTLGYVRNLNINAGGGFTNVQGVIANSGSQIDLYEAGDNVVPAQLAAASLANDSFIYFWTRYPI
jgi:hypothetical protein